MLNFFEGMGYFFRGFQYLLLPGLKRYILLPMILNCFLFIGLFYFSYNFLSDYTADYLAMLPSWFNFLNYMLFVVFFVIFLLLFCSLFTILFNVIAAPFNGLLAEKVQQVIYHRDIPAVSFTRMVGRSIKRQGQFLAYFLPRLLAVLILFFIPFLHPIYPFIWFLFAAWMLSVQFQDLPLDNNLVSFSNMLQLVRRNSMRTMGFGSAINLANFIPFFNILIMPCAVISGTLMYCDTYPENVARINAV